MKVTTCSFFLSFLEEEEEEDWWLIVKQLISISCAVLLCGFETWEWIFEQCDTLSVGDYGDVFCIIDSID